MCSRRRSKTLIAGVVGLILCSLANAETTAEKIMRINEEIAVLNAQLSKAQLEEKLYSWDDDVSSNAVEVHIHHLRKKLGSQFIRTVHGIGYTLGAAE